MSIVTDTWRELVRRRLWPVALLLVGALAAVPVLLAKEPDPAPAPAALPATGGQAQLTVSDSEPIVALATVDEARRRRVLGARKDPFAPAPVKPAKSAANPVGAGPSTSGGQGTDVPAGLSAPVGGGGSGDVTPPASGPSGPSVPPVGVGPTEPEKKPSYPLHTLTVRFGESDGETGKGKVRRLEALPSAEEPVLVYLGVEDGGKVAVFLVDTGVIAQGDGSCKPDPQTCETLHLREGDTEFFDVVDEDDNVTAQYQLDLIDIKRKSVASAAKARKAYAAEAKGGRKVLKARVSSSGPLRYRYDARMGVVKKLPKKVFKAADARATAAVSAVFEPLGE